MICLCSIKLVDPQVFRNRHLCKKPQMAEDSLSTCKDFFMPLADHGPMKLQVCNEEGQCQIYLVFFLETFYLSAR